MVPKSLKLQDQIIIKSFKQGKSLTKLVRTSYIKKIFVY